MTAEDLSVSYERERHGRSPCVYWQSIWWQSTSSLGLIRIQPIIKTRQCRCCDYYCSHCMLRTLTSGYIVTRIMLKNKSRTRRKLKVLLNTQIGSFNYLKARAVHRHRRGGFPLCLPLFSATLSFAVPLKSCQNRNLKKKGKNGKKVSSHRGKY